MLRLDLRLVREILEPAAAASGVMLAGSLDAQRTGMHDFRDERLGVTPLHFRHAGAYGVPRQPAPDEDDEAVQARNAVAAECEAVDGELQLLVLRYGCSHEDQGMRWLARGVRSSREAGVRSPRLGGRLGPASGAKL